MNKSCKNCALWAHLEGSWSPCAAPDIPESHVRLLLATSRDEFSSGFSDLGIEGGTVPAGVLWRMPSMDDQGSHRMIKSEHGEQVRAVAFTHEDHSCGMWEEKEKEDADSEPEALK